MSTVDALAAGNSSRKDVFPSVKREAVQPQLLLDDMINNPKRADSQRATLVSMVAVTGAERALASAPDREQVRVAVTVLAAELPPDLTELVTAFQEAVTARLLSIRR